MPRRVGKFAFDLGLDYEKTRVALSDAIKAERAIAEGADGQLHGTRLASYAVLLVQLVNGSRVSEAFEAVEGWGNSKEREQQVLVRKLGKRVECLVCGESFSKRAKTKSPAVHKSQTGHSDFDDFPSTEKRLMVIPVGCTDSDVPLIVEALGRGLSVGSVKNFAARHLGLNTHALRYAKITSLSSQGQPAQLVSKITHHKNLNFIADYTSQRAADEVLRESVNETKF